jgi:hypothetical protein
MTFITHGFRVSVVSDVRERVRDLGSPLRFMLRRSSLVECVSVLHGTCLQCVEFFFVHQYVQLCLSKNPKYTFYTIKSSMTLAYYYHMKWIYLSHEGGIGPPKLVEHPILVSVPSQESERSCICVSVGYRFCLSLWFWYLIFEIVPTV